MMKRLLERTIEHRPDTWCSRITYPEFVLPRHKHVEYEIMVVTRGSGIRYVGEQAARFEAGDVALIGSNVPHLHLCDSRLHPAKGMVPAAGEVLQFRPDLFPEGMERVPDYRPLVRLLRDSQSGLRFTGEAGLDAELLRRFDRMEPLHGLARVAALFDLLDRMAACRHTELLSATAYDRANWREEGDDPVARAHTYLCNHFRERIRLDEVADYVGMHPSALCRRFGAGAGGGIFHALAGIRIEHACRLLTCSGLSVSQIAYECGYESVSWFMRQFRDRMQCTPSEYRRRSAWH